MRLFGLKKPEMEVDEIVVTNGGEGRQDEKYFESLWARFIGSSEFELVDGNGGVGMVGEGDKVFRRPGVNGAVGKKRVVVTTVRFPRENVDRTGQFAARGEVVFTLNRDVFKGGRRKNLVVVQTPVRDPAGEIFEAIDTLSRRKPR